MVLGGADGYYALYGVSPVPNSTHFCRPSFTIPTTTPLATRCGEGTHTAGLRVTPPMLPLTFFRLPLPGPLRGYLLFLFLYYPLCCLPPSLLCGLPLALRYRLLLWWLWRVRVHFLHLLLELVVMVELQEEAQQLGRRGRFGPPTLIRLESESRRRVERRASFHLDGG